VKVLIPTSGCGSRLDYLTKYTNKALVKVGDEAVISHIIDLYPNGEFVITLGHFGDLVKQFLTLTYPKRKFEFVQVDLYCGRGSNLLKSILYAKDKLQCPFIFHVCDTILKEQPPTPSYNWMLCSTSNKSGTFRTVIAKNETIIKINEKGERNYDYVYAGVAGIYEYKKFWNELTNIVNTSEIEDLSDCHVFSNLIKDTNIKTYVVQKWYDTGNIENLIETKQVYKQKYEVLDKYEESIYFIGDDVVKFFSDQSICKNRVKRSTLLSGLVPEVVGSSNNFYKYKLVNGELFSNIISEEKIHSLVDWAEKNLWTPINIDPSIFKKRCEDFYFTKTKSRIQDYLLLSGEEDKTEIINDIEVPSCDEILSHINKEYICTTKPVIFHGDFILDNILYSDTFTLLDWRQDFAGEIEAGDKYYDLAKLNHNLIINHNIILKNGYNIDTGKDGIRCDVFRSHRLLLCQQVLMSILKERDYDIAKIKLLTPLIWLNMSPLHIYPLNKFLFYFGKYNLWREVCLQQNYI